MRRPQKAFFVLFPFFFLHLCCILRTVPAAMVIVLYSRSQQLLLEKLPQKRKWKPGLHHSQFWAGPQELILLGLIKLKWEFIFAEEATVKTGSVKFVVLSEEQHFLDVFLVYCTYYWRRRVGLPVAQRRPQISSHKNLAAFYKTWQFTWKGKTCSGKTSQC